MKRRILMTNVILLALATFSCTEIIPDPVDEEETMVEPGEKPEELLSTEAFFVAPPPLGNNKNPGTFEEPWGTWDYAFNSPAVSAGDTVYFRGGVYYHTDLNGGQGYDCTVDGQPGAYIHFMNFPGETPILDCGRIVPSGTIHNYPLYMKYVEYVHFKGLHVRNVWQNDGEDEIAAWTIGRSNNVIVENCVVYNTHGIAFRPRNSTEMYYINCDAYNNCDSLTTVPASNPLPGNDGAGFQDYNTVSDSYRVYFKGCRAWNCGDQGFSSGSIGYTEYDGCWSFKNGQLQGGGHGFKMGWISDPTGILNREYVNCIAAYNKGHGWDSNDQGYESGSFYVAKNIAYHNGHAQSKKRVGFCVYNTSSSSEVERTRVYESNIAYDNRDGDLWLVSDAACTEIHNSWNIGTVSSSWFVSLDSTGLAGPRQADGSLPDIDFLKLTQESKNRMGW